MRGIWGRSSILFVRMMDEAAVTLSRHIRNWQQNDASADWNCMEL
jgi:hypothetical protein